MFRLDDVAVARDHEQLVGVAHEQQSFETTEVAIRAPIFGEFDGRSREIAEFVEFALEALEQGEGIGRAAGEPAEDLALTERPHLAGVALHHGRAERDLTITADGDDALAPHAEDRGAVRIETFTHVFFLARGWARS